MKVNAKTVALWSRILQRRPNSRLILKSGLDPETDLRLRRWFAEHGIEHSRVELVGKLSRVGYYQLHNHIDIGLDPFPYNGCVTTCDSLSMGVPVLALAGNSCCSRQGVSLLSNIGMSDWIAATEEEYVALAVHWTNDLARLQTIRAGLGTRVRQSPIGDGQRFTRNLEAAYRGMWQQWCGVAGL
jgi:predicted O-linked N-acetylglucosamine transferase (SPINDLY family)